MLILFAKSRRAGAKICGRVAIALVAAVFQGLTINYSAIAETTRAVYSMTPKPGQEFNDLMRDAERVARDAVERAFANPNVTEVELQIVGDRNGEQVPLLSTRMTRSDWQNYPNIQLWTQYFGTVPSVLLGFRLSDAPEPSSPATASITYGYAPPPEDRNAQASPLRQGTGISRIQEEAQFRRDPAYRDD